MRSRPVFVLFGAAVLASFGLVSPRGLGAQEALVDLPFGPGEQLIYRVHASSVGRLGQGTLSVGGPELLRGREIYLLRFDFEVTIGPVSAGQRSRSWMDPTSLATLRFHKHERRPLARDGSEEVEIYPEERRWTAVGGKTGSAPTDAPLDELSFLYFVRTLPLALGAEFRLDRHFDPQRSPVLVRVLGRETIAVPAGVFSTLLIEMRVRDPERYRGEGRIRMHLLEDERRTPVRIETALPNVGTMTLELESMRAAAFAGPAAAGR